MAEISEVHIHKLRQLGAKLVSALAIMDSIPIYNDTTTDENSPYGFKCRVQKHSDNLACFLNQN